MIANLVPAMALIVLIGSRIARSRAERTMGGGNGRLHVRLVALFLLLAAVPTLLVVIFASLLFLYGDRKSVADGKSVLVLVDLGGSSTIYKKITIHNH